MDRREWMGMTLAAGGALVLPGCAERLEQGQWIQRAIPSSGEMLPALGLGSAATFSSVARSDEVDELIGLTNASSIAISSD